MADLIKYPTGAADLKTPAFADPLELSVNNTMTIVNVAQLTAATTIDLTIHSEMPIGALLVVRLQSDATARNVTPGTGMEGPVIAGVIGKTKVATFVFDGTNYVMCGTPVQID